jgi:mRNA interferase MazF
MPFEFGDVVLVRFPFTDRTGAKQRPAAVVSNRAYNEARPDIVVAAITTSFKPTDILVHEWHAAGLLRPSAFKPLLATIEQGIVVRHLGALALADQAALRKLLADMLG